MGTLSYGQSHSISAHSFGYSFTQKKLSIHHHGSKKGVQSIGKIIRGLVMLEAIAGFLLIVWLLGVVTYFESGGYIHILLVLAVLMVLTRVVRGSDA